MHHLGDDTEQFQRLEILKIRKCRQEQQGHTGYGALAITLGLAATAATAAVLHDVLAYPTDIATHDDMALLALAVFLAIAASAATLTWMIVRNQRRLAAQNDLIADDLTQQNLKAIRLVVAEALTEHSRQERLKRFNDLFGAADGTTGRRIPHQGVGDSRPPDERTQVIQLGDRQRRNSSSSSSG